MDDIPAAVINNEIDRTAAASNDNVILIGIVE
jgi:hypothetical protein